MVKRPAFWNKETQDIDEYWYNRVSAVVYPLIGATILVHQASQVFKGKPIAEEGINPIFIAIAGYAIYKSVKCGALVKS